MLDAYLPPAVSPPFRAGGRRHSTVIVALMGPPARDDVIDIGVALAEEHTARLTIAAVCRDVPLTAALAPMMSPWTISQLRDDALAETAGWARTAVHSVPLNISVDHRVVRGHPARALAPLLDGTLVRALVLPARCRRERRLGRAVRAWVAAGVDIRFAAAAEAGDETPSGQGRLGHRHRGGQ